MLILLESQGSDDVPYFVVAFLNLVDENSDITWNRDEARGGCWSMRYAITTSACFLSCHEENNHLSLKHTLKEMVIYWSVLAADMIDRPPIRLPVHPTATDGFTVIPHRLPILRLKSNSLMSSCPLGDHPACLRALMNYAQRR